MKSTLFNYILGLFLRYAIALMLGLSGLLSIFDLLANADEVLSENKHGLRASLAYMSLRFPAILTLIIPFASMLAAMAVLARFVQHSEMLAMRAAGITIYRIAGILLFAATLLACLHFYIAEAHRPVATRKLNSWSQADYKGMPPRQPRHALPAWFAAPDYLIHVGNAAPDGRNIYDLTIVARDKQGLITHGYRAGRAVYAHGRWHLYDVASAHAEAARAKRAEDRQKINLDIALRPADFSRLRDNPDEMSFADLAGYIRHPGITASGDVRASLWLQQKLAAPLAGLVLVLIAMPLGLHVGRQSRLMGYSTGVIGTAFTYFVAARILLSLGEAGILVPAIAVWTPPFVFAAIAWWLLVIAQE